VIWEKTDGGAQLKQQIDSAIRHSKELSDTRLHDVWMFDQLKVVGPQNIFGEVVLI
jgi:hypothetical protein